MFSTTMFLCTVSVFEPIISLLFFALKAWPRKYGIKNFPKKKWKYLTNELLCVCKWVWFCKRKKNIYKKVWKNTEYKEENTEQGTSYENLRMTFSHLYFDQSCIFPDVVLSFTSALPFGKLIILLVHKK